MRLLRRLLGAEAGQDLIEYTILLALLALGSAALMYNTGPSVSQIWTATNTALTVPDGSGSPSGSTTTTPVQPSGSGGTGNNGNGDRDHDGH